MTFTKEVEKSILKHLGLDVMTYGLITGTKLFGAWTNFIKVKVPNLDLKSLDIKRPVSMYHGIFNGFQEGHREGFLTLLALVYNDLEDTSFKNHENFHLKLHLEIELYFSPIATFLVNDKKHPTHYDDIYSDLEGLYELATDIIDDTDYPMRVVLALLTFITTDDEYMTRYKVGFNPEEFIFALTDPSTNDRTLYINKLIHLTADSLLPVLSVSHETIEGILRKLYQFKRRETKVVFNNPFYINSDDLNKLAMCCAMFMESNSLSRFMYRKPFLNKVNLLLKGELTLSQFEEAVHNSGLSLDYKCRVAHKELYRGILYSGLNLSVEFTDEKNSSFGEVFDALASIAEANDIHYFGEYHDIPQNFTKQILNMLEEDLAITNNPIPNL